MGPSGIWVLHGNNTNWKIPSSSQNLSCSGELSGTRNRARIYLTLPLPCLFRVRSSIQRLLVISSFSTYHCKTCGQYNDFHPILTQRSPLRSRRTTSVAGTRGPSRACASCTTARTTANWSSRPAAPTPASCSGRLRRLLARVADTRTQKMFEVRFLLETPAGAGDRN